MKEKSPTLMPRSCLAAVARRPGSTLKAVTSWQVQPLLSLVPAIPNTLAETCSLLPSRESAAWGEVLDVNWVWRAVGVRPVGLPQVKPLPHSGAVDSVGTSSTSVSVGTFTLHKPKARIPMHIPSRIPFPPT